MITFCCKGGVTYLVAVAMHIAFASPTSGHFVAWSNQFPNCLIGSKDTSWLSSKHCEQNNQLNMNALRNTHIYLNYTCLLWLFKDRPEVVQGLKHLESMKTQLPSAVLSHTVFRTTRTAACTLRGLQHLLISSQQCSQTVKTVDLVDMCKNILPWHR